MTIRTAAEALGIVIIRLKRKEASSFFSQSGSAEQTGGRAHLQFSINKAVTTGVE